MNNARHATMADRRGVSAGHVPPAVRDGDAAAKLGVYAMQMWGRQTAAFQCLRAEQFADWLQVVDADANGLDGHQQRHA